MGSAREGVAGLGALRLSSVGLLDIDILVGRRVVDGIAVPRIGIVVDMPYEHTVAGNIRVPSRLLTVLEEEKLVGV